MLIFPLNKKRILLGITGGIAAYKCPELIRQLISLKAEVRVVLTENGARFVTPETLGALSQHFVYQSLWSEGQSENISHIELARWAEAIVVAPATANFIAKLSSGLCDDLLTTVCLATNAPIVIVPAMNKNMWLNPATQSNINLLQNRGLYIWGPDEGFQACGETGFGRMLEPQEIISRMNQLLIPKSFSRKKFLITAGATREFIDPIRYISNRSSGKMGYALAEAAFEAGAKVLLISGETMTISLPYIQRIKVTTAEEMRNAVMENIENFDVFISAAAVSDYRVASPSLQKIKKSREKWMIELVRNSDILKEVSLLKRRPFTVGFAAETENLIENAYKKLEEKKLDMIAANLVGENKGFESDFNELWVITKQENKRIEYNKKIIIARELLKMIKENLSIQQEKSTCF